MRIGEGKEIQKSFTDFPMQLAACSQEHVVEKINEKDARTMYSVLCDLW